MRFLAIDTATNLLSLALLEGQPQEDCWEIVATYNAKAKKQHGESLAPALANLMNLNDWTAASVEGVIVGLGPGSYTGVRIGVTFAKVWAQARKLPLYTVSSLALMVPPMPTLVLESCQDSLVLPMIDARRQTAYLGLYQWQQGQLVNLVPDQHQELTTWLEQQQAPLLSARKLYLVGQDLTAFAPIIQAAYPALEISLLDDWAAQPFVERLIKRPITAVEDIATLTPNYTHQTLAEAEWLSEHLRAGDKQAGQIKAEDLIDHFY